MMDAVQITHMIVSGLTSAAALYFKMAHSKLLTKVDVLEKRIRKGKKRLDRLESGRKK
jgi:hypothetical protein